MRGAQLKAMGVQPGWPDILVLHEGNRLGAVGIELKSEKGVQSDEQKAVMEMFHRLGAGYAIARTVEHVEVILRQNEVPLHATLLGLAMPRAA